MKYCIQILFSLTITSCSSTKNLPIDKIEGKYLWTSIYGVGETIEFKSDSTFTFHWTQGLMNGETKGKIHFDNSQTILYSEFKKDAFKYKLEIPPQTKQDYYEIMVADDDWNRFIGATCQAYSKGKLVQGQSTNEMGICRIESLEIDSIAIGYLGYQDAELSIEKNRTPKSLIVKLKEENHYHYFEGQSLKIINRRTIELETFNRKKIFKRIKNET